MSKIGLVTFHRSTSYGASLQTYATYHYLTKLGHDVVVVDYTNLHEQEFRKWSFKENGKLSGYATSFIKNVIFKKKYYSDMAFGDPQKYYKLSGTRYFSKADLESVKFDCLVAGSDQIWSPKITNGIDDVYLLNFGIADRRVSVASSLGSVVLSNEEHQIFKEAFNRFTAISVREPFAKSQLQIDTDLPIKVLLDPTFLLEKTDWEKDLIDKSQYKGISEDYILTFFVAPQSDYKKRVQEFSDKLGLPIWSVQPTKIKRVNSERIFAGIKIEDFLALINNAKLVITDSFHGTALAINLETDFVSFKNVDNPVRVETLLKLLGIDDRIDLDAERYVPVNYLIANDRLKPLVVESQAWVRSALGD